MDHDLQLIHDRWSELTDLERGTASWVVERLVHRHLGSIATFDLDQLEEVLTFFADDADKEWHCDCCPRRPRR